MRNVGLVVVLSVLAVLIIPFATSGLQIFGDNESGVIDIRVPQAGVTDGGNSSFNQTFADGRYCRLAGNFFCYMVGGVLFQDNFGLGWPDTGNASITSPGLGFINVVTNLISFNGPASFNKGIRGNLVINGSGAARVNVNVTGNVTADRFCYANGSCIQIPQAFTINYTQVISNLTSANDMQWIVDNFYFCTTTGAIGEENWFAQSGGAQTSGYQCKTEDNHNGVVAIDTGAAAGTPLKVLSKTSTNLFSSHILNGGEFLEFYVRIYNATPVNTSNNVIQSTNIWGFADSTTTFLNVTDGVYFQADTNYTDMNMNFTIRTASAGVRTSLMTNVSVINSTWDKLTIYIDNGCSNAYFWINDTFVGNISSNIPCTPEGLLTIMQGYNTSTIPQTRVLHTGIDWIRYSSPR